MIPALGAGRRPSTLPGFADDDLGTALAAFRRSAIAHRDGVPALRPARPGVDGLDEAFAAALALGPDVTPDMAASFFDRTFTAHRPSGADGFLTGYYEPEVDGALARSADFTTPLLARPADLGTLAADADRPSWAGTLAALRRLPDGTLAPYPDRAAIEATGDPGAFRPVVWVRDRVEAFLIHVQGSARVRLPDGSRLRVTYAGRNGHPYTSVGRIAVDSGAIPAADMSLDRLKAWLRGAGPAGDDIMARNRSFIFFDAIADDGQHGPTGGAGVPLTALRSVAVDRALWCYGLPFWIDAALPWREPNVEPFRRLTVAQDTGSAILGPARVDVFLGLGPAAGTLAGGFRHGGDVWVLLPRQAGARQAGARP